jgi:hypothetical protein
MDVIENIPNISDYTPLAAGSASLGLPEILQNFQGLSPPQTTRISNEEVKIRTRAAMARNMKSIMDLRNKCWDETALICGGGPSLADTVGTLRKLYNRGHKIICTNKTHDWLVKRNFKPHAVVLLDPMPHVSQYVKLATPQTKVLIAGQCHEDTFNALSHADCYLWHADASDPNFVTDDEIVPGHLLRDEYPTRAWRVLAGGNTGGLRSIFIAQFLGFKSTHLFGFDSSMREGKLYAYDKAHPADADEGTATLRINGHEASFYSNEHMTRQVELFEGVLKHIEDWNTKGLWNPIDFPIVHGDGMLPSLAAGYGLHADPEMNAKWARKTPGEKDQEAR